MESSRLWLTVVLTNAATLLVMCSLHGELQSLYSRLTASEERAKREALIDSLTGIGNRAAIIGRLEKIARAPLSGKRYGFLLMDLNRFKRINDTLGHHTGDELLRSVAERLASAIAVTNIGRLGGDEFAIIAEASGEAALRKLSASIAALFDTPFKLSTGDCFVECCIGSCLIEEKFEISSVLRRADVALYRAKETGAAYRLFDEELMAQEEKQITLSQDLALSLSAGEGLFAEFQPILGRTGAWEGLEAFFRWDHPRLGMVTPTEAVTIAERCQLIDPCERFVADQAIKAALRFPDLAVYINVSALQLLDLSFSRWLLSRLRQNKVSARQIVIEVNERTMVERAHQLSQALSFLRNGGVQIAVDNFGNGALVSLSTLKRLGVTVVKFDRNLLREIEASGNNSTMRALVTLAESLGMEVIATGVDSRRLYSIADQAGIELKQGFELSRPARLEALSRGKTAA
ncbi:MAG: EAL domain-containing protein [Parvularcula sp.]|nr:EAL domain-containing protein [Parvularcula sp.]